MKIGIDTDGVITDMLAFNTAYGREHLHREPACPAGRTLHEMYAFKRWKKPVFYIRAFRAYTRQCPPRAGAADVLRVLRAAGHEVISVTARYGTLSHTPFRAISRRALSRFYEENGLVFDKVVYCTEQAGEHSKKAACQRENITLAVDDDPDIALSLAESGIRVLLFDCPYNRDCTHENITRVTTWDEIAEAIAGVENEKE